MLKPIKINWLEECDSTSRVLKELTMGKSSSNFEDPLVVSAGCQTLGAGRLGRSWASLHGNLHYSIALPAKLIAPDLRDILPLTMGSLIAQWIENEFNIRPCLKWPNDILIDGLKVGGILCEGSIQGTELTGIIVGLGLNLQTAPGLTEEGNYAAGSLLQLTGKRLAAKDATESLTEFIRKEWPKQSLELVLDRWQHFAIGKDHLWTNKNSSIPSSSPKNYYRNLGISNQGFLQLAEKSASNSLSHASIEVTSSHNEYAWTVQVSKQILVADVGNTMTKIAIMNQSDLNLKSAQSGSDSISVANDELKLQNKAFIDEFQRWKNLNLKDTDPVIHALSVNTEAFKSLQDVAQILQLDVRLIQKNPIRVTQSKYDLNMIGIDRLGTLEAVKYLHLKAELSWPVMCVSLGTATTVDMIDGGGVHLGGFIFAGINTSLNAIANKGSQLPKTLNEDIDMHASQERWPENTSEAMTWASWCSTLATLKSERARLAKHCGMDSEKITVVLTGGFAGLIKSTWDDSNVIHCKDLALLGAVLMGINGR